MKKINTLFLLLTLCVLNSFSQEPYLGEIRIVSFNYAPKGWAFCNGQLLPISQNQALFSLLGTQYGGNGQTTFALPDLRGKIAMDATNQFSIGQTGGEINHTLTASEMPWHIHNVENLVVTEKANSAAGNLDTPTANYVAKNDKRGNEFNSKANTSSAKIPLTGNTIGVSGQSLPHNNMAPYTVVNFVIALQGIFPSQN